jgi:cytochrome c-type biogenesis protein CcmH
VIRWRLASLTRPLILAWFIAVASLLVSSLAFAAIETYDFSDEQGQKRYHQLIEELRCPKCQNQNIADSNAPIAQDLRREVHRMIEEGESDNNIVSFMVERYGDFVIYRPRFDSSTFLLWFGPLVVAVLGMVVILLMVRNTRKRTSDSVLSSAEQQRLDQLLNDQEKS